MLLHMQIESNIFHFGNSQSFGFLLDFSHFSLLLGIALSQPA